MGCQQNNVLQHWPRLASAKRLTIKRTPTKRVKAYTPILCPPQTAKYWEGAACGIHERGGEGQELAGDARSPAQRHVAASTACGRFKSEPDTRRAAQPSPGRLGQHQGNQRGLTLMMCTTGLGVKSAGSLLTKRLMMNCSAFWITFAYSLLGYWGRQVVETPECWYHKGVRVETGKGRRGGRGTTARGRA